MKPDLLIAILTLLKSGATQREVERFTGVDRGPSIAHGAICRDTRWWRLGLNHHDPEQHEVGTSVTRHLSYLVTNVKGVGVH